MNNTERRTGGESVFRLSPGSDKAVKWHLCPGFVRVTIILIRWAVFEKAFSLGFQMKATLMNSKVMKDLDT